MKTKNLTPELRDNRYWLINPLVHLVVGTASGYILEKNGINDSAVDLCFQMGFPVALGSLEYLVKRCIKKQKDINGDIIAGSNAAGLAILNGANKFGRYLAKLI